MSTTMERYNTCTGGVGSGMGKMLPYMLRARGPSGFSSGSTAAEVVSGWDGSGKVAIVTGAGSGMGAESARALASRGCHVVMAGRDTSKIGLAAASIRKTYPDAKLTVMELDLANLKSVSSFASDFLSTGLPLNILLLNAGVMSCPLMATADGHEMQFGTNHLGHFLLTRKLLPKMVDTAAASKVQGRVVAVASLAHQMPSAMKGAPFETSMPSADKYDKWLAYGQSKLCNVLFARELQKRLAAQGADVIATSLHPGCIITDLQRHLHVNQIITGLGWLLTRPIFKSVAQGAATQVYCCTAPGVKGGEYYTDVNVYPSNAWTQDMTLGGRLWEESEKLCSAFLP